MREERRFSQVIAEGDGISLVVAADDPAAVTAAESGGADALAVRAAPTATTPLPVLFRAGDSPDVALAAGADAWVLPAERTGEDEELDRLYARALESGLDCVVEVFEEEQLERVMVRLDPEVVLLSSRRSGAAEQLERVLELLHDLPAGKLAVADLDGVDRPTLGELERAGVDAVIVAPQTLVELAS